MSLTPFVCAWQVGLTKGLKAKGNVEDWLCKVEQAMCISLKRLSKAAIADYEEKAREEWVVAGHPSQVPALTHTHTHFTCIFNHILHLIQSLHFHFLSII